MSRISNADYQCRLDNLRARIAEHELDLFLVSSRDNIYYLT
jgi:Xaa-Pro aminopeptidase